MTNKSVSKMVAACEKATAESDMSDLDPFPGRVSRYHWTPCYRWRPMGEMFLLTNEAGQWIVIPDNEFKQLQGLSLVKPLFEKLETEGMITTRDNAAVMFEARQRWERNHYRGTQLHIVGTTNRCNLSCRYCHTSSLPTSADKKLDMSPSVAFKVVDFAFQSPVKSLAFEFQGGESLLNPQSIKSVYDYARLKQLAYDKKIKFSVVTNLTLATEEMIRYLLSSGINVTTTLDGIPDVHDWQRPFISGKGSWRAVSEGIEKLKKLGSKAGCLIVITKPLLKQLPRVIDRFNELGIHRAFLSPVEMNGRAIENWDDIGFEIEEFLESWCAVIDQLLERTAEGFYFQERMFSLALRKVLSPRDVGYMDFRNPCGMLIGQMAYTPDGGIYTCDEARGVEEFRVGSVLDDSFSDVMSSPKTHELVSLSLTDAPECQTCAYKPYCCPCPVLSFSAGKGKRPKPIEDRNCRWHQGILDYTFRKVIESPEKVRMYLRAAELHNALDCD